MPNREDKRRIRQNIEALEAAFAAGQPVNAGQIEAIADDIKRLQFSPDSGYYDRLEELYQKVSGPAFRNKDAPAQRIHKTDYIGTLDSYAVGVRPVFDHIFLSRYYSGEYRRKTAMFRVTHRFNEQGRADLVDANLIQSLERTLDGAIRHLITVDGYQQMPKDWSKAEAYFLSCLPFEMIFFERNYLRLERRDRYHLLLAKGHQLAGDVINGLMSGDVKPADIEISSERPLQELTSDAESMVMLKKASELTPFVELSGEKLKVSYK